MRTILFCFSAAAATLLLAPQSARAQHNNPTGPAGQFNGNSSVGCSYDPFTGNATRTINDINVAGAVGAYPLQWSRTLNSRKIGGDPNGFGDGGGWRHSYSWTANADAEGVGTQTPPPPTSYSVDFPDGRSVFFSRAVAGDTCLHGPIGVPERFQKMDPTSKIAYLILPDGGKVEFTATIATYYDVDFQQWHSWWAFRATALIDTYGLRTTMAYSGTTNILTRVTEPGGRWLQISYSSGRVSRVDAQYPLGTSTVTTQSVTYSYGSQLFGGITNSVLTAATYLTDAGSPSATYTYQAANIGATAKPLIATCNDLHYAGPMKSIAYEFQPVSAGGFYGQLLREKHIGGTPVVTLSISGNTRTETRGDGGVRSFTFGVASQTGYNVPATYLLSDSTDFRGNRSYFGYDSNGFLNITKNPRNAETSFTRLALTGKITLVTLPKDAANVNHTVTTAYLDTATGYYVSSITNERGYVTSYTRDPSSKRITQINYPTITGGPASYETFTYNGFGEVLTHRMTSGGTESSTYDARGLKKTSTPPATPSDLNPGAHPALFDYDTNDQLSKATDPRGNATTYGYDAPSRATRVTHPDGSYAQKGYNLDGTVAWEADENHPGAATDATQRTRYAYDDYKRVTSVTNPLNQATSFTYALDWNNPYQHTTSNPKTVTSPLQRNMVYDYDANFRKTSEVQAFTTADEAWTQFTYDAAGNLASIIEPRGATTTFAYDLRNRKTSATDPAPFNTQVTRWEYDGAGNMIKETRPDTKFRTAIYDPMNHVIDGYGFGNERTQQRRDAAGNVDQITDAKNAVYGFGYDVLNRKTSATYPADATGAVRTETWTYDIAGNLYQYKNPAGQVKTITYDNRNRPDVASWSGNTAPTVNTDFDNASRLTRVATTNAGVGNDTVVAFGYDNANRQIWEDQTFAGVTHRVSTPVNADGLRETLEIPGSYQIHFDYTQRNQLAHVLEGNYSGWIEYTYDLNGNLLKRRNQQIGDCLNFLDASGVNQYDALNRPGLIENTAGGNAWFARDHYQYDSNDRAQATWRDLPGQATSRGDRYSYDAIGQLTKVQYNATNAWTITPTNVQQTVNYNVNALNRNGTTTVDANGTQVAADTYTANGLNQYTAITGHDNPGYDGNFNVGYLDGGFPHYDAENRLIDVVAGSPLLQNVYDGLGRCVKRVYNNETRLFTYDGWKPIAEWDAGATSMTAWNVYGSGADEILVRGGNQYGRLQYHTDRLGSVIALLDASGTIVEKYTYDAFGVPTVTNADGSGARNSSNYDNRFMFTGREYFPTLAIYDYRHRYYRPGLGRFLQPDPTGFAADDMNLFRYCAGDPVNNVDPTGEYGRIRVYGNSINIDLPIRYTTMGPFARPMPSGAVAAFNEGIHQYLSGDIGGFHVETNVVPGSANVVRVIDGKGTSLSHKGGPDGYWFAGGSNGQTPGYTAAHEALHLLGLPIEIGRQDYYTIQNGQPVPIQGYEKTLLGGIGGTEFTPQNLTDILAIQSRLGFITTIASFFPSGTPLSFSYSLTVPKSGNWIYGRNDAPPGSIVGNLNGQTIYQGTGGTSLNVNSIIAWLHWGGTTQSRIPFRPY